MKHRRAKIVCTIGPAVDSRDQIAGLIAAGMDVARLNFSHGKPDEHAKRARWIAEESDTAGRPVAILQDLCGPKIRTGTKGPAKARQGELIELIEGSEGNETQVAVDYPELVADVRVGDRILLSDGHIELRVERLAERLVECRVEHGGPLRARMGVNLPSERMRGSALTDKDRSDLEFGLSLGVDYIALSFVRNVADIVQLRKLCASHGRIVPIVAKIETPGAVDQIDAIVQAADAVMVARGDLGVELPPESVPVIQKQIIGACRAHQRPVIVATEMLQSMVSAPRPTRAETSDVANAVFDGADAVMLSGETAAGKFPLLACQMMDRIVRRAEASQFFQPRSSVPDDHTQEAIADAACAVAKTINARIIVALTSSGGTARLVSKARPEATIVALSPEAKTLRKLALNWGVVPRFLEMLPDVDELVRRTGMYLREHGFCEAGDRYVLTYGAPIGVRGSTNAIRVEQV